MNSVLNLYKEVGETPLQRINRFRKEHPEYKDNKMTYAGRLDPTAEGVLLALVGEECKSKESYLELSKTYTFEVLFGIETDTYDILGKILNITDSPNVSIDNIKKHLSGFEGQIIQKYPPFSSKAIKGKPLFEWAKEGRIDEMELPEKVNYVYKISLKEDYLISFSKIYSKLISITGSLEGDFRQKEMLNEWKNIEKEDEKFPVVSIKIDCSSGTYVRDIAHRLGRDLEVGATTLHIRRERVGDYEIKNSLKSAGA